MSQRKIRSLKAPAEIAWLTSVIGDDAALLLIEARGGTRVYVPLKPAEACPLALAIGATPAKAMADAYGSVYVKVPTCRPWRIDIYRSRGMSYAEIALRLGCTESAVWRHLSRTQQTTSQLSFDLTPSLEGISRRVART